MLVSKAVRRSCSSVLAEASSSISIASEPGDSLPPRNLSHSAERNEEQPCSLSPFPESSVPRTTAWMSRHGIPTVTFAQTAENNRHRARTNQTRGQYNTEWIDTNGLGSQEKQEQKRLTLATKDDDDDGQTDRQAGRQTDRQTDRQTEKNYELPVTRVFGELNLAKSEHGALQDSAGPC